MVVLLIVLDAFVALTAIGGGLAMALDLDKRVDPAWLAGTRFPSYRVPGVVLAGVVGGCSLVAAVALVVDEVVGAAVSAAAGVVLMGWISVEVRLLDQPSAPTVTERVYFGIGGTQLVVATALLVT